MPLFGAVPADQNVQVDVNELAYSQITAAVSVTATSAATATTVIAGSAVSYDGGAIILEFFAPQIQTPSAAPGNSFMLNLWDGATDLGYFGQCITAAASTLCVPVLLRRRLVPTVASHTYGVRAWTPSGTNGVVGAGVGGIGVLVPAYLRVTRA